ncbi:hypothetical protein [Micromonospora auratinigra]|uniref:Uncharacterized protein n=1 Tax=Micromonospora auratinigra TaxID=261654 RepID=A0A1A8Z522_9ACTN|nr:hypothetical protein [Micromonospora auratinigra]SBT38904.1 hypothetical protein GA0070611_0714 [Micromonospora auratinigra]
MTDLQGRGAGWWLRRTSLVGALLVLVKFVLILIIVGSEAYLGSIQPGGTFLALGFEVLLSLLPTVLLLALLSVVGPALGLGLAFRVLTVVLIAAVATLTFVFIGWIVYAMIALIGQLVVAAVAIRYVDALQPRNGSVE